jgi:hypothetical protein
MLKSAIINTAVISFITVNFKEPMELSVITLTEHFDISGFHGSVDEIFTFLGCYAKYVGSCLTMF